jgi:hypothetical protein
MEALCFRGLGSLQRFHVPVGVLRENLMAFGTALQRIGDYAGLSPGQRTQAVQRAVADALGPACCSFLVNSHCLGVQMRDVLGLDDHWLAVDGLQTPAANVTTAVKLVHALHDALGSVEDETSVAGGTSTAVVVVGSVQSPLGPANGGTVPYGTISVDRECHFIHLFGAHAIELHTRRASKKRPLSPPAYAEFVGLACKLGIALVNAADPGVVHAVRADAKAQLPHAAPHALTVLSQGFLPTVALMQGDVPVVSAAITFMDVLQRLKRFVEQCFRQGAALAVDDIVSAVERAALMVCEREAGVLITAWDRAVTSYNLEFRVAIDRVLAGVMHSSAFDTAVRQCAVPGFAAMFRAEVTAVTAELAMQAANERALAGLGAQAPARTAAATLAGAAVSMASAVVAGGSARPTLKRERPAEPPKRDAEKEQRVCRNMLLRGRCRYGRDCRYSHDQEALAAALAAAMEKPTKVAW